MSWLIGLLAFAVVAPGTEGQTGPKPPPAQVNRSMGAMGLWDADVMMEQATIGISRRYNLDESQEEYTRQLLRKRTKEFLSIYEEEVRALLKELFMQQLSGNPPTPEQSKDWGRRAGPLLQAAKKAILDGNMEWRDILTEEQKKVHDLDLRLMDQNFRILEARFDRWKEGQFRPGDWMGNPPPQTAQARQRSATKPPQPVEARRAEDYWELFVKKFIRDYQLDEAQRNSALAVLADVRDKAAHFRRRTAGDRKRADQELRRLMQEKGPSEQIRLWSRKRRELDQPISDLFAELKSRLANIPTEAQRRRVPKDYISQSVTTRPAKGTGKTTQPAEEKPASGAKTEEPPKGQPKTGSGPTGKQGPPAKETPAAKKDR